MLQQPLEGNIIDTTPKLLAELEQRKRAEKARERKRNTDLRVRDIKARERLFMLLYICMLIGAMLIGVIIGKVWR